MEFFEECFVCDSVNLSALSKALHVPHDFLVGYVFEHGLGGLVTGIRAAAAAFAQRNDQVTGQVAAALKAEGRNVLKQLAANGALHAVTSVLLYVTASPAWMFAVTVLPVALGGFALDGPNSVGPRGSCFQFALKGGAMLSAVMLAVTAIELTTGSGLVVVCERIDFDNGIIFDDGMEK